MRVKYNTLPSYNPLFPIPNSRFAAVHPAATCEPAAGHNNVGRRNLHSPAYPHPGCHPFDLYLRHLTPGKGYLSPTQLHRKLRYLRNPSTPGRVQA